MHLENLALEFAILCNLVTVLISFRVDPYSHPDGYSLGTNSEQNSFSGQIPRSQTPSNVQPYQNYFWLPTNPGFQHETNSGFESNNNHHHHYHHHQSLTPRSSEHFHAATGEKFSVGNSFGSPDNYGGKNVGDSYSSQKSEWRGTEAYKTPKTIHETNEEFYRSSSFVSHDLPNFNVGTSNNNSTPDKIERNVILNRPKRIRPNSTKPQGGQIVFPDGFNKPNFTPSKFDCTSSTFCEQVGDDYPTEYINRVLRKEGAKFKEFFGQEKEFVPDSNITERINFADEDYLCPYRQEIIYPKAAKNKEDKWLFIVNHDKYLQGVKVEICSNPNKQCSLTEGFPLGYTTYCKQKYIERKMVALGEEGKPRSDYFILPSCCSCVVKYTTPGTRLLSSRNKKPARKTREQMGS